MGLAAPARAAAPLPFADDLARTAQTARERRIPVLLAFMQQTCPYCARARRQLEPLQASPEWSGKAIMLEVDVDSTAPLRDFDGRTTTPRDFARRHDIRMVPTVIVFDGRGRPAGERIVGIGLEDYYSFYVEQALEAGAVKAKER